MLQLQFEQSFVRSTFKSFHAIIGDKHYVTNIVESNNLTCVGFVFAVNFNTIAGHWQQKNT